MGDGTRSQGTDGTSGGARGTNRDASTNRGAGTGQGARSPGGEPAGAGSQDPAASGLGCGVVGFGLLVGGLIFASVSVIGRTALPALLAVIPALWALFKVYSLAAEVRQSAGVIQNLRASLDRLKAEVRQTRSDAGLPPPAGERPVPEGPGVAAGTVAEVWDVEGAETGVSEPGRRKPVEHAPVPVSSAGPALAAAEVGPARPVGSEKLAAPSKPPSPHFDWGKVWRTAAGPLAGTERRGRLGATGTSGAASTEARLGTVWLSRVGILLLIAGAILGYRYGVANDTLRVVIGYVAGLALLGLGGWGHKKGYRAWSQGITGGGLGVIYLTTIAANTIFSPAIIPDPVAFGVMVLVSVLGTGLAVLYDGPVIGVLGMVGAFSTAYPLVTGPYDFRLLFTYVAILDAGLVLVAYFKRWSWYNYLAFLATWGLYFLWRSQFDGAAADVPWAFGFVTIFFVIFALVSITYSVVRRRKSTQLDLALVLLTGFIYLWSGLGFLWGSYGVVRGFFVFGLAAVYLVMGLVAVARHREDRLLVLGLLGLAGVFLTVAFPVALRGPWIAVAWALEGAILVWVGFLARARGVTWGGLTVLALAAGRLLVWETFPALFGNPLPVPAMRTAMFLLAVAAFYLATWAYSRNKGSTAVLGALAIGGNVLSLWYITWEICLHFGQPYYTGAPGATYAAGILSLPFIVAGVWGLYGLALSLSDIVLRRQGVRTGARVVLGAALAWLTLGGLVGATGVSGIVASAELAGQAARQSGLIASVGAVWLAELVIRLRAKAGAGSGQPERRVESTRVAIDRSNGALSLAASGVAFVALAVEVLRLLAPHLAPVLGQVAGPSFRAWQLSTQVFAVASTWGLYAILVMVAGVILRSSATRTAAAVYQGLAILLLAVLGARNPAAAPALRATAFGLVVVGAYLSAFLSSRAGSTRPASEVTTAGGTVLAATALTAWWGVGELSGLIAARPLLLGATSATVPPGMPPIPPGVIGSSTTLFAVVAWLGLYALAVAGVGSRLRSAGTRWVAIVLQVASVVVLTSGLGNLTSAWPIRAAAFVLGILSIYATSRALKPPGRSRAEAAAGTWLSLAACALTLVWAGFEIGAIYPAWPNQPPGVSVFDLRNHWIVLVTGAYGLAVTMASLWLRSEKGRVLGLGMQALAVGGATVLAVGNLFAPGVLRLAAFAVAIGGLYLVTWLFRRTSGRASPVEVKAAEWLSLAAAAVTVVWITGQVQAYFIQFAGLGSAAEQAFTRSTLDFAVSAAWGVYGFLVLAAGFILHHRWTRVLGLAVLALTVGKITVSDMWHLAVGWRIWITLGIGVLLVVASFMYQRFARIILGGARGKEAGT